MEYQWRSGSRINVDPQVAGDELNRICDEHGKLEASTVVEEARPQDALLHPAFEWNNKVAAEEWRRHQARNLIRCIQVIPAQTPDAIPVQVFVHVPAANKEPGYYQSVEIAVQNPDEAARALDELRSKLNGAIKAFESFQQLSQGQSRKVRSQIKKVGTALGDAKAAIAEIAG